MIKETEALVSTSMSLPFCRARLVWGRHPARSDQAVVMGGKQGDRTVVPFVKRLLLIE